LRNPHRRREKRRLRTVRGGPLEFILAAVRSTDTSNSILGKGVPGTVMPLLRKKGRFDGKVANSFLWVRNWWNQAESSPL